MVEATLITVAERRSRLNGVRYLCHLNALIWLVPAAIYLVFPFDFPIPVNWYVVLPIIAATIMVPYVSASFASVLKFQPPQAGESATFLRLIFLAALLSPALLFIDLFIFRGLSPLGDIEINRAIYMETGSSAVGYIALFGLAASLYLLTKSREDFSKWFLLPWLANVLIFILSGNRQYALLGIILLFFSRFIGRTSRITVLSVIYFFSGVLAFAAAALSMQFLRQLSKEGRQTEFLYAISGIECRGWICENPIEPPLLYIYGYFGNIYSGLTIAASDIVHAPVLSLTVPVLYRRFSSLIDAPRQDVVTERIANSIEGRHDIFPNFWATMHAAAYYEGGFVGVLILLALAFIFLTYVFSVWIKFGGSRFKSFACIGMSLLAVGVMYFPLSEPVNFFLFVGVCCSLLMLPRSKVWKSAI